MSFRPSVLSLPQNYLVKPRNKKFRFTEQTPSLNPSKKKSIICILRWYVWRPRHWHECCATRLLTREPSRPTTSQFSHKCCICPFLVMSSILCKATVTWQWKVSYWLMLECLAAYLYTCSWNSWFFVSVGKQQLLMPTFISTDLVSVKYILLAHWISEGNVC